METFEHSKQEIAKKKGWKKKGGISSFDPSSLYSGYGFARDNRIADTNWRQ